jgi:hypothetical protein
MTYKKLLLASLALASSVGAALAGGAFNGYPIVGDPGNTTCLSYGNNGVCNQYSPAGPSGIPNGAVIPADTGNPSGQNPQTVLIPVQLLHQSAINRLIGGDMTTNLNQRSATTKGIAALAGLSPTAAVMTADRWWTIAPAAGVTVTIDSTLSTAAVPGMNNTKALRIARTSSGAAGVICTGQTLDNAASTPLIGNNAVFSFYAFNGAGQSATNGNITVNVDYTSDGDTAGTQATLGFAGGNGSKFALGDAGQAGTPGNYTAAIAGFSDGTTGSIASGVATIQASTTWTRYSVYAPIPVNVPGTTTPVTAVSVSVCFKPVATTAISTDYIELNYMQLEAKSSAATLTAANGITAPTPFEKRLPQVEATLQYQYLYFLYESQSLVAPVPFTSCTTTTSTTAGACLVSYPVPMRIAPAVKYTDGFQMFTSTAYTTLGALSSLATYVNTLTTVPSNTAVMFKATASTLPAVGSANFLMQLGTSSATGIISVSAEP